MLSFKPYDERKQEPAEVREFSHCALRGQYFHCPEESSRFSRALEAIVFDSPEVNDDVDAIVEFGSGSGVPVIQALLRSGFSRPISGYEINSAACEQAQNAIRRYGLGQIYKVNNASFFCDFAPPLGDCLIANPPYLPALSDEGLLLPDLWGGQDGNSITKKLLSLNYKWVFLEISSYSNPLDVLCYAHECGYRIQNFQMHPLSLGSYSRQPKVWQRLAEMKASGKAFFSSQQYLVGSALFVKEGKTGCDLASELANCLTSIR